MFLGLQRATPAGIPQTIQYKAGCPIVSSGYSKATSAKAAENLNAQNAMLSKEKMVELTYGPKRPDVPSFVPEYVKLDSKVLTFEGVIKYEVEDCSNEKERIHFVKVLYFLENDTMKVMEPRVPNSGLYQGMMFKRDLYMHPSTVRNYHWRDFNIGQDIYIFGRTIHLYNCDEWTRVFLTEQGIEVKDPETRPENPIVREREAMLGRGEERSLLPHEHYNPAIQFYRNDGRILKFYGIYVNDMQSPIRRIILKYFLADDTLEVLESWTPNSGRNPMLPSDTEVFDNNPLSTSSEIWSIVVKRQKVLMDNKTVEQIPCYLEPGAEDNLTYITFMDLKTDQEIKILGKTFYLNKCNKFTEEFYKTHYGIDMPQIEIMEKPKMAKYTLIPPHTYGPWEQTLRDCFKPHEKLRPKINKMSLKPRDVAETTLRFSAIMDSPRETDQDRTFVISFFMEDDTLKIYEERGKNSGHLGGLFLSRSRVRKDLGKIPELTHSLPKGAKPQYYEAADLYIGANIRAGGSVFVIKDTDLATIRFMEKHPEIFPETDPKEQRELSDFLKGIIRPSHVEKMNLLQELKDEVLFHYGLPIVPYPKTLNLGSDLRPCNIVEEELYCANLPISQKTLKKLVDTFTCKGKTDVNEVKTFLTVALGHDRLH